MTLSLSPQHSAVKNYYKGISEFRSHQNSRHERAISSCFLSLLQYCTKQIPQVTLIPEYPIKRDKGNHPLRADGALVDSQTQVLIYGLWEAKDDDDNLEKEIKKKFKDGYPRDNILFQNPKQLILYQGGDRVFEGEIEENRQNLVTGLNQFFGYKPPAYAQWEEAVEQFKETVGELGGKLVEVVTDQLKLGKNRAFASAFDALVGLSRQNINPNITHAAVIEMLVQHLLTERLFRTVFNNPDFVNRNSIAREIEKAITALTAQSFSRHEFLKSLDRFYVSIEETASTIHAYSRKQDFLNVVYEKFFQGFAVKVADTHGIVYTPQPIVDFMVNSVQEILKQEFGLGLASPDVHILDPFTGTGNFIMRVMREIGIADLDRKYTQELHCNEIMLLPYYIANMNIEHAYFERTGQYKPFEKICLVDTFEMAESAQVKMSFFNPENTERVNAQKATDMFVIMGNPPYNVGQQNENDNNKNRKYPHLDGLIEQRYAKPSKATNKNSLSDAYVKAFAWATERLEKQENGVIAFVTNNGFLEGIATDGMRKHLGESFSKVYHIDLKGNARTSGERRRQEGGNIFNDQIRVGVGITFLVKCAKEDKKPADIFIYRVDDYLRVKEKQTLLSTLHDISKVAFKQAQVDKNHTWHTGYIASDFEAFTPIGSKDGKAADSQAEGVIFKAYSNGVKTNRDASAYNFNADDLSKNMQSSIQFYNEHVFRYSCLKPKPDIDGFVVYDEKKLSWSRDLKLDLHRGKFAEFRPEKIRNSLYRPFTKRYLFLDRIMNEEVYQFPSIFPTPTTEQENRVICFSGVGSSKPFHCLTVKLIPCLDILEKTQCFPFFTYDETGEHRQENITHWALRDYQSYYADEKISKWDIFYYVYGLLHHQGYRDKYAANLKRELPRIPKLKDFWTLSRAGKQLAELHVNYEAQPEYPLKIEEQTELGFVDELYRVEKMRFSPDKTAIFYNDNLMLCGIPPEALEYKLGNRSALDWIIDQYQVSTDKRSGIVNDPNSFENPRHIIQLIQKVVTVSIETVKLVKVISGCGLGI